MKGAPARAIQELAGHQELGTTQRYIHLTPATLEAAIRLLEPPGIAHAGGDILEAGSGRSEKVLSQKNLNGVGDGFRTRDFLSHSQALYP
jgi:hypothetical protein